MTRASESSGAPRPRDIAGHAPGDAKVLRRKWTTAEGWRDTKAGMWAWLIQRGAAVLLVVAIALHLMNPFRRPVQAAVLALVLVHGLLGVRSLLLDFGLPVRWHRPLFALALGLATLIFALVWRWRWY
jgi:succinate dehydrogenase hydrophobic anchor subunit